ncbi:sodium-independent anion transporter [Neptunitalea chrysea]|uniref:Sodium-independent anion transporter n=1 Tax=Neptunitalea chrysea TaxID=1647581 RepID=A0A9W6ETD9_9FLAO|nr:SulP family inorganic anion transporter [Neptunitalea chrysea]GLB51815.1 sodium-independent anion transporter [Neptunitalea chrysea]
MKQLLNLFDLKQKVNYKTEILAGLTVAMTMIPESLSFALLAGFPPLVGLYGAFIMGLITSILGGRPGLISGGAGATVVVLIALMKSNGLEYVFGAIIVAGIIQIAVGLFKLGKFIRLVPQSVMYGFVNGLAIIIFMSQLKPFQVESNDVTTWLSGTPLLIMAGLVALTIAIILILPKITKAVPSSLVAIIVVFAIVYFFQIDTEQIRDKASISGSLPPFHIPQIPFTLKALQIIIPYGLIMAMVGLTEGLLTLNLVDEITGTRGRSNKECVAQGTANIANGFFFGMGGCPMIAQTLVNLSAGSRARLSGIVASLTILIIIIVGGPVIELLPIAALTGVMFMVAIGTFEWTSLKVFGKMPLTDVIVMLIVMAVTVFMHNLALAVLIGIIISALAFAWENAKRIRARKYIDDNGIKHYEIYGPLFFGSTTAFNQKFDIKGDPKEVIIDFSESRVADMSAIEALNTLTEKYQKAGKKIHLKHLSQDCIKLLKNADKIVDVNILEDPNYKVMTNEL